MLCITNKSQATEHSSDGRAEDCRRLKNKEIFRSVVRVRLLGFFKFKTLFYLFYLFLMLSFCRSVPGPQSQGGTQSQHLHLCDDGDGRGDGGDDGDDHGHDCGCACASASAVFHH